jgi:hypothetical protein
LIQVAAKPRIVVEPPKGCLWHNQVFSPFRARKLKVGNSRKVAGQMISRILPRHIAGEVPNLASVNSDQLGIAFADNEEARVARHVLPHQVLDAPDEPFVRAELVSCRFFRPEKLAELVER